MTKTDTGGPAYPVHHLTDDALGRSGTGFPAKDIVGNQVWVNSGGAGMTLLDAAALEAFPEKLRIYSSDKDAVKYAYHAGEEFIAEKRRRESE